MSFFYDVLSYFDLNNAGDYSLVSYLPNIGAVIYGDYKIEILSDSEIIARNNKRKDIIIKGTNLHIKSISKGEIVIEGKVVMVCCDGNE